jgi:hypothetical protein
MGDEAQRTFATNLGISLTTLRKVLAGEPVRDGRRRQIESKLASATAGVGDHEPDVHAGLSGHLPGGPLGAARSAL